MIASECIFRGPGESNDLVPSGEVVELTLLVHRRDFSALERLARARDVTVAQLLRGMIGDFLAYESRLNSACEEQPSADAL